MIRNNSEPSSGVPVRNMIAVAGLTALMLFNFAGATFAQDDVQPAPRPDVQRPYQAPIGHVQPTLRDLPPGVAETETKRTKAQEEFDKKLQICRNC
jgi:hypothetical protein